MGYPHPEKLHACELVWRVAHTLPRAFAGLEMDAPLVGVEVGVDRAWTSQVLLRWFPGLTLYMIDPQGVYPAGSRYRATRDVRSRRGERKWRAVRREAEERVSFAGPRAHFVRTLSHEAVRSFADGMLDFAFIDGDHSYAAVREDIADWLPKVKPAGVFGGHDYAKAQEPGVQRAVDDWCRESGESVETGMGWTWWRVNRRSPPGLPKAAAPARKRWR